VYTPSRALAARGDDQARARGATSAFAFGQSSPRAYGDDQARAREATSLVVCCESWPALPQPIKAGILAMILAADGVE
jgi:hypothetical protein